MRIFTLTVFTIVLFSCNYKYVPKRDKKDWNSKDSIYLKCHGIDSIFWKEAGLY